MYIYFVLISVAVLVIISIIVLTVFVMKNALRRKKQEFVTPPAAPKTEWKHIKDFSDINAEKESKVNSFKDEFSDEVNTVGADILNFKNKEDKSDFDDNLNKSSENNSASASDIQVDTQLGRMSMEEFVNDFKTISFDSEEDLVGDASSESYSDYKNQWDNNHNNNISKSQRNAVLEDNDIDYDATRSLEDIDYDATRSLEDIDLPKERKIQVTLKYKDANGSKIQKMETDQITVGRGIGNDLLFRSDSFTSRNHAIFDIRDNELYIEDLNSKNGTYINKTIKVEGEMKLEESCEITFGDVIVEVIIEK